MTLDEMTAELEQDLPLKLTQMQTEAANNPVLYGKWSRYRAALQKERIKIAADLKEANKAAMMFNTGRGDDVCMEVFTPTELKSVIPADPEVLRQAKALELVDAKLELCYNAMDAIRQRGFSIKTITELRKMENGD